METTTAVSATATTVQGPVQIGILVLVRFHKSAAGRNHFPAQDIVGSEAEAGTDRRVASSLGITASNTDGRALTSYNNQTFVAGSRHDLEPLDTGTQLEGCATVI